MIKVFENKSYRVKGVSFHPTKPWVLASLHNGFINLIDYINGIVLHTFEDHEGPVRSIDFHYCQPLFVSGGDDNKIKVWNYQLKKNMFTLAGHNDYIRTVQFHHEFPWIISSSDDQTIRIWNWQNRTLLTTATGHDHYVMSAFFHPTQNFIVSASLDQSIRIWDYSNLRKKYIEVKTQGLQVIEMDVVLKHKLDGHERGVNWAVFHPTYNLVASGSDDKTVRIFKFSDTRWDEVDCFRGHSNNVASVIFDANHDLLISVSEDKTFKIWDLEKKTSVFTEKKENDRFWIVGGHPSSNLFGLGTDSGIIINKLESSRIPSSMVSNNQMIYYHKQSFNFMKDGDTGSVLIREVKDYFKNVKPFKNKVKFITSNPFMSGTSNQTSNILNYGVMVQGIESDVSHMVYYLLKPETKFNSYNGIENQIDCTSFCFISKTKMAIFDNKKSTLIICETHNLSNSVTYDLGNISNDSIDSIHQAVQGKLILKLKNGIVCLVDLNSKKIISETNEINDFKFIVWNSQMSSAALVGQNTVTIVNKNMEICHQLRENSNIKSAIFDEHNILYYSTYFHIKYSLTNGLSGIVKSTESTFYLMMVVNFTIHYSDCKSTRNSFKFNSSEIKFNLALNNKNYEEIVHYLKSGQISGLKTIDSLKSSGFPELSLKFVNDPKQKFILALKSGNLEVAKEVADTLKEKAYYNKLAEKALLMGKLNIVEYCYVRSQNLDKLLFFYLLTGKFDKLKKLENVLKDKGENSRKFLNLIYLANHNEKIKMLSENGHYSLALLAAKLHKNEQFEKMISSNVKNFNEEDYENLKNKAKPIVQLKPVINVKNTDYHSNWATTVELRKNSGNKDIDELISQNEQIENEEKFEIGNDMKFDEEEPPKPKKEEKKIKVANKWGDDDEEEEEIEPMNEGIKTNVIDMTIKEEEKYKIKFKNSDVPGVQAVLGNLSSLKILLQNQLGITSLATLKPILKDIYMSSYSQVRTSPCGGPLELVVKNKEMKNKGECSLPHSSINLSRINNLLDLAYESFDNKDIEQAEDYFRKIISYSIFFIPLSKEEEEEIKGVINTCTEYLIMLKLNGLADEKKSDKFLFSQICLLITLCQLAKPIHRFYMLKRAKIATKNVKNYISTVGVLYRMLALEKELKDFEGLEFDKLLNEYNVLKERGNEKDYSFNMKELEKKPARESINAETLQLFSSTTQKLHCALCSASYSENKSGKLCDVCNLTTIGKEASGLKLIDEFN